MENIEVAADGTGKAEIMNKQLTLADSPNSLFHEGGTAIVIHASPDDNMTDPAGNAGARIACGVITK
jgi:Cu-Zn family superoxide dismutase